MSEIYNFFNNIRHFHELCDVLCPDGQDFQADLRLSCITNTFLKVCALLKVCIYL